MGLSHQHPYSALLGNGEALDQRRPAMALQDLDEIPNGELMMAMKPPSQLSQKRQHITVE